MLRYLDSSKESFQQYYYAISYGVMKALSINLIGAQHVALLGAQWMH